MPNDSNSARLPKVSVITPTYNRAALHRAAYAVFSSQTVADREWIVVDDSETPSQFLAGLDDPKVKYIYLDKRSSTGSKRNLAIAEASGEIIAQFDDDDFYRDNYLQIMISNMFQNNADFIKLSSFFVYLKRENIFGYWDLMDKGKIHYSFAPEGKIELTTFQDNPNVQVMHLGYGFSYVFKRTVWETTPFEDKYWKQDTPFATSALKNGYKVALLPDKAGLSLHVIHDQNASKSFPQYLIPEFMIRKFFPRIDEFLNLSA